MTLQATPPITLGDVEAEYGAPSGTPLGAFVRGGAWVPDNAVNVGVPTSKPISLGDLLGSENFTFIKTHDLTAGQSGGNTGLDGTGGYGSLVPTTFKGGQNVVIRFAVLSGNFQILLDPSGLLATKWLRLNFESTDGNWNGVQLLAADATFNPNVGGFSSWTFAGQSAFINGTAYQLDWQNF